MAPSYADVPARSQYGPRTPAERAEDAHAVQLRLKQEAADRRQQAPEAHTQTASAGPVTPSSSAAR
jgi:hypothetical protein